jgi:hypothetical protein
MDKLTTNEKLVAGGGVLLLIASFLPWHRVCVDGGGFIPDFCASLNGWDEGSSPWIILAVLVGAAMATVVVLDKLTSVDLPAKLGSLSWSRVHLIGGIAVAALVLIKLLDESSYLSYGFYIGAVAAAALAAGGILMSRESPASGTSEFGGGMPPAAPPPPA